MNTNKKFGQKVQSVPKTVLNVSALSTQVIEFPTDIVVFTITIVDCHANEMQIGNLVNN